jgi:GntR family transcriptional regulator
MNHYVRKEFGDKMQAFELGNVSYYSLYEKILKQPLYKSDALITAVQASPEVANILKVKIGTALIWYRGITFLEGNIPVEVNYSLFLGDRFQFETRMFKPREVKMELELSSASNTNV